MGYNLIFNQILSDQPAESQWVFSFPVFSCQKKKNCGQTTLRHIAALAWHTSNTSQNSLLLPITRALLQAKTVRKSPIITWSAYILHEPLPIWLAQRNLNSELWPLSNREKDAIWIPLGKNIPVFSFFSIEFNTLKN